MWWRHFVFSTGSALAKRSTGIYTFQLSAREATSRIRNTKLIQLQKEFPIYFLFLKIKSEASTPNALQLCKDRDYSKRTFGYNRSTLEKVWSTVVIDLHPSKCDLTLRNCANLTGLAACRETFWPTDLYSMNGIRLRLLNRKWHCQDFSDVSTSNTWH